MSASISINPIALTNAAGSFNISSAGFIQGTEMADPSARHWLSGGILGPNETLPMWGGVGISEATTPVSSAVAAPLPNLGGYITRATTLTAGASGQLTGFSVFTQDHSMITTPQSQVPLAGSLMGVNFYRTGSNARIPVACDPSLISLDGGVITQDVSWDFNNQVLVPYSSSGTPITVSSMTWAATNGGQIAIVTGSAAPVGAVGDVVNISGATTNGTGGNSVVNGNFVVNTFTDNQHFTVTANKGNSGFYGTIAGSPVINVGSGILPVRVLEVAVGNSMTVSFDPVTGFATWNRSGSCALILI